MFTANRKNIYIVAEAFSGAMRPGHGHEYSLGSECTKEHIATKKNYQFGVHMAVL